MKELYTDYPEHYSEEVVEKLNSEYGDKKISPLSFLSQIRKENEMNKTSTFQNETETPQNNITQPGIINENYRLYSLISSNYCSLINLLENTIAKTSSAKRDTLQRITAQLRVDHNTFNEEFFTTCSMEPYTFCNYNQLIYRTIENFIELTENLSLLVQTPLISSQLATANRLKDSAFDLFTEYIQLHPIRY